MVFRQQNRQRGTIILLEYLLIQESTDLPVILYKLGLLLRAGNDKQWMIWFKYYLNLNPLVWNNMLSLRLEIL